MFLTREDWMHHMKNAHSVKCWVCEYCSNLKGRDVFSFSTRDELSSHLEAVHSTFENLTLPLSDIVDLGARDVLPEVKCPLCIDKDSLYDLENSTHVSDHLHLFALDAIQWPDGSSEVKSSLNGVSSPDYEAPQERAPKRMSTETDEDPEEHTQVQTNVQSKESVALPLWIESLQDVEFDPPSELADQASVSMRPPVNEAPLNFGSMDSRHQLPHPFRSSSTNSVPDQLLSSPSKASSTSPNAFSRDESEPRQGDMQPSKSNLLKKFFGRRKQSIEVMKLLTEQKDIDRGRTATIRPGGGTSKKKKSLGERGTLTAASASAAAGTNIPETSQEGQFVLEYIPCYHLGEHRVLDYLGRLFPGFEFNLQWVSLRQERARS